MHRSRAVSHAAARVDNSPQFRKYAKEVERSLAAFDQVTEWADFVTFLARLLKSLQTYPGIDDIPHKQLVAKRLAQCLNPALPTGVHQRALDVYVHILSTIGPENLIENLTIWSSGLFPFFQYAATSVRPIVLGIYSKFYLPLQEALRPCTKAFILALLPGMDEETGEFFDKVSSLLDQLSGTVSPPFFFQHIWLILLTSPASRTPALNYLSRRMPLIKSEDRLGPIVGDDVALMTRGLSAALTDSLVYVQRSALDLMISAVHLNGVAFKDELRPEDRLLLMQNALNIVLKRDLSLSRRLYSWLLGNGETPESQMAYLKEHGLETLCSVLRDDMNNLQNLDASDRQRPFKIFLALLDKWEIGSQITNVLVLDVLSTLNTCFALQGHPELRSTASILFEALDPHLTWRQLYFGLRTDFENGTVQHIRTVDFVLHHMPIKDSEIARVQHPLLAFGLLTLIKNAVIENAEALTSTVSEGVALFKDLLDEVQPDFFVLSRSLQDGAAESAEVGDVDDLIRQFYSSETALATLPLNLGSHLRQEAFQTLFRLIGKLSARKTEGRTSSIANLLEAMSLLAHAEHSALLKVDSADWAQPASLVISNAFHNVEDFDLLCSYISATKSFLETGIMSGEIGSETVVLLTTQLLQFLTNQSSAVHVEAARYFWTCQEIFGVEQVENILSARMLSDDLRIKENAFEAFGNLWRLTEDEQLPSRSLSKPLFIVLEATQSRDTILKRLSEAFMRCSFRSYLRLLDPMLLALADAGIHREPFAKTIGNRQINLRRYTKPFDTARILYILRHVYDLFLTRGAGFHKTAKASLVRSSPDPQVAKKMALFGAEDLAYLDALCLILLDFLASSPAADLEITMNHANTYIHNAALDTLQIIVQRADLEPSILRMIQYTLLARLLDSLEGHVLDLQNKYLHTLHATMQARAIVEKKQTLYRKSIDKNRPSHISNNLNDSELHSAQVVDDLFAQTILLGFQSTRDTPTLHYWVDFLFMTVNSMQRSMDSIVYPLAGIITARLWDVVRAIKESGYVNDADSKGKARALSSGKTGIDESECVALTGALERLVLFALDEARASERDAATSDERGHHAGTPSISSEPNSSISGGFLTYVTGAFSSTEAGSSNEPVNTTTLLAVTRLAEAVAVFAAASDACSQSSNSAPPINSSTITSSRSFLTSRILGRCKRSLDKIFKMYPTETIEAFALLHKGASDDDYNLELLDQLNSAPQVVVAACCDRIDFVTTPPRKHRLLKNNDLSDYQTLQFLKSYIMRLGGPVVLGVWNPMNAFVKLIVAPNQTNKSLLFPTWECYASLCEKMGKTSALEDRRIRKELQDNLLRLLDLAIPFVLRESEKISKASLYSNASPKLVQGLEKDESAEEKVNISREAHAMLMPDPESKLLAFLSTNIVPNFKLFMIDSEKVAATCASIMQQCITPKLNQRGKQFDAPAPVFTLLQEITRITSASKVWRPLIMDWFFDNKFFNSTPDLCWLWRAPVQSYLASDKERIPDLINRISTSSSSANIFANKDAENTSRALSMRRLSFALFTAEKNKYLINLPAIQEKIADLLKTSVQSQHPVIQSEVYLLLRVVLCKISDQHLASLWPIVLTELLRLFESSLMVEEVSQLQDQLPLLLAACKFLDLLLVLQTEEFQIHEWMFVTDTVDAILPPDAWTPVAVIDRLSVWLSQHQTKSTSAEISSNLGGKPSSRTLLLNGIRQNTNFQDLSVLKAFIDKISLYNYEATYQRLPIDYNVIFDGIAGDMFEG